MPDMNRPTLHHFHSSSTSFRVRIALAVKGIDYQSVPIHLRWQDGDHDRPEYRAFNPQGNVPVLVDGGHPIVQSLAIIDYLDRTHPEPPLFPADPAGRARVWSLALWIACEIQPPNNLRVQRHLAATAGLDQSALSRWQRHWIQIGFDALETQLASSSATGRFCHGDTPTAADCCLVPQVYNALRPVVGMDLAVWPTIDRIYRHCLTLPAVSSSLPTSQPDFESPAGH